MGPHKSRKDLVGEYERLQHDEDACLRLISLIESDDHIQMTDYFYKAMLTPTGKVADNQTSRTAVNNLAAERLTNRPPEPVWSRDIERGHLDEPLAREVYEQWKGVDVTEVGFMTRNIEGYVLGFSPDG